MATHSCILAYRISWTEESDWLYFMGSQRVRYNWATLILKKKSYFELHTLFVCLSKSLTCMYIICYKQQIKQNKIRGSDFLKGQGTHSAVDLKRYHKKFFIFFLTNIFPRKTLYSKRLFLSSSMKKQKGLVVSSGLCMFISIGLPSSWAPAMPFSETDNTIW